MVNARQKGVRFERQVIALLKEELGDVAEELRRDLDQYRTKDQGDLIGIPGFTIECKRRGHKRDPNLFDEAWWTQVCRSCGDNIPILIYKLDYYPIRGVVPMYAINPELPKRTEDRAVVEWNALMMIIREHLCD